METGCAPGNPDLNEDHCITIMAGIHTKQYMSETKLTHVAQWPPNHEVNISWSNTSFHENANKTLLFSWHFKMWVNKILNATMNYDYWANF